MFKSLKKFSNQTIFSFFKKDKPKIAPLEKYAKINDLDTIYKNLLDETLTSRKPLPDKEDKKLTVFLEPDNLLFKVMSPDIMEGFILYPNKECDFYFPL